MKIEALYTSVILALAIASASTTISRAKVFESVREAIGRKSEWLGKLISCAYCTSHWLSFGAVAIYRPRLIHHFLIVDLMITAFVIVTLASFGSWALIRFLDSTSSNATDSRSRRPSVV